MQGYKGIGTDHTFPEFSTTHVLPAGSYGGDRPLQDPRVVSQALQTNFMDFDNGFLISLIPVLQAAPSNIRSIYY
eukprot:4243559-Heterocapsa_arctica.AAC.1